MRVIEHDKLPVQLHREQRFHSFADHGEQLRKSGVDSAWQRLIQLSFSERAISNYERLSLHNLSEAGTDKVANRADHHNVLGPRYDNKALRKGRSKNHTFKAALHPSVAIERETQSQLQEFLFVDSQAARISASPPSLRISSARSSEFAATRRKTTCS